MTMTKAHWSVAQAKASLSKVLLAAAQSPQVTLRAVEVTAYLVDTTS